MVVYNVPAVGMKSTGALTNVALSQATQLGVEQLYVLAAVRGRVAQPQIKGTING